MRIILCMMMLSFPAYADDESADDSPGAGVVVGAAAVAAAVAIGVGIATNR